jgi:hypothetical protein
MLERRNLPGFLGAPVNYDTGGDPGVDNYSVAAVDLTRSGHLDLVTPTSVLLNNGDGTFQPPRMLPTMGNLRALTMGDLRGNGLLDIIEADGGGLFGGGPGGVLVLLGNGDGTFQPAVEYRAGLNPAAVAVGDFNGDGHLDVAVANSADSGGTPSVSILLGNGDGTLQPAVNLPIAGKAYSVAVGDFNHDGSLDLAVGHIGPSSVSIFLGNGDGSFQSPQDQPTPGSPESVAVGDFNGDGHLDLAVAASTISSAVSVLLGNGDGTFQPAQNYATSGQVRTVAAADLNGDGHPDLVVSNQMGGLVSVFLGNGDGTFQPSQPYVASSDVTWGLAVGDFSGSGVPNIAVGTRGGVTILANNGDGTFSSAPSYSAGSGISRVLTGDFRGNGISDLVTSSNHDVHVLLGQGDGTFQDGGSFPTGSMASRGFAAGDFNGDGKLDLVVANGGSSGVSILLGNGDGTFQAPLLFPAGRDPATVAVGDFNGDGHLDLAVVNLSLPLMNATLAVLLGNGDGTFQAPVTYTIGRNPTAVTVGDFNNDGNLDLVVLNQGDQPFAPPGLSVLLGNGDGTFQTARFIQTPDLGPSLVVGDFNHDGNLDVALTTVHVGVNLLLGNGDGTFQSPYRIGPSSLGLLAVGDFDRDGNLDIVHETGNGVRLLLGRGDGTFNATVSYVPGGPLVVGDFNGDDYPDVGVLGPSSPGGGAVSVLLNDRAWHLGPGGAPGPGGTRDPRPHAAPGAADLQPVSRISPPTLSAARAEAVTQAAPAARSAWVKEESQLVEAETTRCAEITTDRRRLLDRLQVDREGSWDGYWIDTFILSGDGPWFAGPDLGNKVISRTHPASPAG